MLEFLSPYSADDAIVILKADHEKVKGIFDEFEKAEDLRQKKKLVAEAIMELKIHAAIEEEIFYPTVRKAIGKKVMNEADEEHHVVKLLIAELEVLDAKDDHYDAKFKVLSENVRHHIKEEERDMLPHSRGLDIDFVALGRTMLDRKAFLKKNGVDTSLEEKAMSKNRGKNDSPAEAAKRGRPAVKNNASKGSAAKKKAPVKVAGAKNKTPLKAVPKGKTAGKSKATTNAKNAKSSTPQKKMAAGKNSKPASSNKKTLAKPALKKKAAGRNNR